MNTVEISHLTQKFANVTAIDEYRKRKNYRTNWS